MALQLIAGQLSVNVTGGVAGIGSIVRVTNLPNTGQNTYMVVGIMQLSNGYAAAQRSNIVFTSRGKNFAADQLTLVT